MDADLALVHRPGKTMPDSDSNRAVHIYCLEKGEEPTRVRNPHRSVPLPCEGRGDSTEGTFDIRAD